MTKRPKLFYLFAAIFLWLFFRDLSALIFFRNSANFLLFAGIGHPSWHFCQLVPLTILEGLAVWFLMRPSPVGLRVILVAILVSAATAVWQTTTVLQNPDLAKQSYVTYRQARGLSLHEERLDTFVSPAFMFSSLAAILLLNCAMAIYLVWRRNDFARNEAAH